MILDEIVAYKREFLIEAKRKSPLAEVKARAHDAGAIAHFGTAIRRSAGPNSDVRVIAEVKKASPSKGVIRADFDPLAIAGRYAEAGAAAASVLTDEKYFQGSIRYLEAIHANLPQLPILRKDFTIDEYQIMEARASGASAVLLIAGVLDAHQLRDFRELAEGLGMTALTEVHSEKEADIAAECGARIIGVNNRNLQTFEVDIHQTGRIIQFLGGPSPEFCFVGESGIAHRADVDLLLRAGVDAILVGESLMRQPDPGTALQQLLAAAHADARSN